MSSAAHHQDHVTSAAVPRAALPSAPRPIATALIWLSRAIPTAVVVTALGGLALWGHFSDWKLPKFSALVGKQDESVEEWCQEHNVPEEACIECKSTLLPLAKDYGWCKEHGVAQCPLEHPEVAQIKLPPVITPAMLDRASRALAVKPRAENSSLCRMHLKRVQFASVEAIEKAGVDIAVVQERPIIEAATANGEVVYDQNRMAHLSSRVTGTVWQVERQVGDRVRKGDCLALVDSADVGKAKAELLHAIAQVRLRQANFDRLQAIGEGAIALRQLREADTALAEATIREHGAQQSLVNLGLPVRAQDLARLDTAEIGRRLHFLGLPDDLAMQLDENATTANLFPVRAPLDGIVIERHVVAGEVVDTNTALFAVADISQMWLTLNVREDDAKYILVGQPVLFRPNSGAADSEFRGSVAWISTSADDQTRTVRVRVELPNEDGRLRANTFGIGRIVLREEPKSIVVPSEAVHWDGNCHVVFVRDKNYHQPESPKFFHVRSVRLGVKEAETTEIIAGLLPGEVIASKNSVVLEAQLLKSNLGAGCGCADGH
ncbi:MAG TPA: efflux RND transporter periplasmic adaptor subunit [Pirellulaceae bacterium]|jgi:cobalt-zinc-cadmium efflux system membrane fusion protein